MTKRLLVLLAATLLAGFALAACGGDDDGETSETSDTAATQATTETSGGGSGGGSTIAISADPGGALAYEQTEVTTKAGPNTIDFTNDASVPHDVVVEDGSEELARTDVIQEDTTSTEAEFEPGSFTFYCSVPGHREAGMEGVLEVE